MKKWEIQYTVHSTQYTVDKLIKILLEHRGIKTPQERELFFNPPNPSNPSRPSSVGIDKISLHQAVRRIKKAIDKKESVVVYADYDADGITAGAIMWETLHRLGAAVMPYIPHRVEEGYGLSHKGIDTVVAQYHPTLIITVDHGITAKEKVAYAASLGIDVIVTDHHVKPKALPSCTIVHTTKLSGAGVSWFLAKELLVPKRLNPVGSVGSVGLQGLTLTDFQSGILALAAIGTIADMVPLVGPNRAIAKYGLAAINHTDRVGLEALISDAGLVKGSLGTFDVSHMLAPRLNAMGRIEHALDALRLLCTKQKDKAQLLAQKLGLTNRERQKLTEETVTHALGVLKVLALLKQGEDLGKLLFVVHESYNQGVIGLVAGKLVEEFYRPAIVVAKGEMISKASARSVSGFNIVEAIRSCSDILVDVGGHPMAAGFTVETKHLQVLQDRLEQIAEKELTEEKLTRVLRIDAEIPLTTATEDLWQKLRDFEPFGFGNPEPVFATRGVTIADARLVGKEGKHLKLHVTSPDISAVIPASSSVIPAKAGIQSSVDAIAFGLGSLYGQLKPDHPVDIAYTIDMNVWNGNKKLQLKIKDIH